VPLRLIFPGDMFQTAGCLLPCKGLPKMDLVCRQLGPSLGASLSARPDLHCRSYDILPFDCSILR
jgi:hypothetical protein